MPWPLTTERNASGELLVGGIPLTRLADEYGTPLYVFDEATLRTRAQRFRDAFASTYPRSRVLYAAKAYLSPALVAILHAERLGLDVSSGGEVYAGLASGVPAAKMTFHGNGKTDEELREAVEAGVGLIAVDNRWELRRLVGVATSAGTRVSILLRLNPGVDVHTHAKIRTGAIDSKFGLPVGGGEAAAAVDEALASPALDLAGYHAHLGSQLFDPEAYVDGIEAILGFAAAMRDRHGDPAVPRVVSPGGGFGVAYLPDEADADPATWGAVAADALRAGCARYGLPLPELVVEPGRAIIGPAGVALYRVGATKEIPGVRRYAMVDGGMADNIRPALYDAGYAVALANRAEDGPVLPVTVAGKYCESGDVLVRDAPLPALVGGDLLAIPAAGAYTLSMSSNYNLARRPAAVLVNGGQARLIRRRETYADLLAADLLPEVPAPPRTTRETPLATVSGA